MSQTAPLLVTAAIIRKGDRYLLAQRKADATMEASKWEFPGGKVELFESPEDCLRREIREELNLEIKVDRIFRVQSHVAMNANGERRHIVLLCYLCDSIGGDLRLLDAQDARWVTLEEMAQIPDSDFAAADVPVVHDLCRRI